MQGVLAPTIKLRVFRSLGGLQVLTFGSVSFILTLASKWGCDTEIFLRFLLGSPRKKCHSDVGAMGKRREYYMGEGGGFP